MTTLIIGFSVPALSPSAFSQTIQCRPPFLPYLEDALVASLPDGLSNSNFSSNTVGLSYRVAGNFVYDFGERQLPDNQRSEFASRRSANRCQSDNRIDGPRGLTGSVENGVMKNHCRTMAQLLVATLQNSQSDPELQTKALETTLLMVAETAEINARSEIAQLKAQHQQEVAQLQVQLARLSNQSNSTHQLREWLNPIYANLNRNFRQMQLVNASNAALNRTLTLLERQISRESMAAKTIKNTTINNSEVKQFGAAQLRPMQGSHSPIGSKQNSKISQKSTIPAATIRAHQIADLEKAFPLPTRRLVPVYTPDKPLKPMFGSSQKR